MSGFILRIPQNIKPIAYELIGDIDPYRQWLYMDNSGFALNTLGGIVKDDNWIKDNLYPISVFYLAN